MSVWHSTLSTKPPADGTVCTLLSWYKLSTFTHKCTWKTLGWTFTGLGINLGRHVSEPKGRWGLKTAAPKSLTVSFHQCIQWSEHLVQWFCYEVPTLTLQLVSFKEKTTLLKWKVLSKSYGWGHGLCHTQG